MARRGLFLQGACRRRPTVAGSRAVMVAERSVTVRVTVAARSVTVRVTVAARSVTVRVTVQVVK
jgi:hypothetical protein